MTQDISASTPFIVFGDIGNGHFIYLDINSKAINVGNEPDECPICLQELDLSVGNNVSSKFDKTNDNHIFYLRCDGEQNNKKTHLLHFGCLKEHFEKNGTCPLDRKEITFNQGVVPMVLHGVGFQQKSTYFKVINLADIKWSQVEPQIVKNVLKVVVGAKSFNDISEFQKIMLQSLEGFLSNCVNNNNKKEVMNVDEN